jgi:ion channel-forming bestrophin family protein
MYIGKKMGIHAMWVFARKNIIKTAILSSAVTCVYQLLHWKFIAIPFLPVATIGTAVAFYIGFKNNQAYDRLWEARQLWGGFTNVSRTLTASIISLIDDKEVRKSIMQKHIAYINIVRLQLRKTIPWATNREDYHRQVISASDEVKEFDAAIEALFDHMDKKELFEQIKHKGNIANLALKSQFVTVLKLKRDGIIDEYEHSDLMRLLGELYDLQGGCERIKTTPLFRQYSLFSRIFVNLFILLLPFGLINEMSKFGEYGIWLTIPFTTLISWVFMTMEQIGEASENPFDNGLNDTPISTICRNIEIDILEMLGETDLPPKLEPYNNVML